MSEKFKFPPIYVEKMNVNINKINLSTKPNSKFKVPYTSIETPTESDKKKEKEPLRNTFDFGVTHEEGVTKADVNGVYNHELTDDSRVSFSHSHQIDHTGRQSSQSKLKFTHDIGENSAFDISLQHHIKAGARARTDFQAAFNHNVKYAGGRTGTMSANVSIGSNGRIRSASVKCDFNL